jgi:hypothetical protein
MAERIATKGWHSPSEHMPLPDVEHLVKSGAVLTTHSLLAHFDVMHWSGVAQSASLVHATQFPSSMQ